MIRLFFVVLICLMVACSNRGSGNAVLSKEQMSNVLWDMIQLDELATWQLVKDTAKNPKKQRIQLYEKVFQLHKTSEKQFSQSFSYYMNRPDVMKTLFDSLEARGIRERTSINIKKDSLPK